MVEEGNLIIPKEIDNNEPLLRAVSAPSCLDGENRATHLAFRLRNNEKDLSLSRLLYEELRLFLKRSFRINFKFLSLKDAPSGAVELNAGEINGLDDHIVLRATPHKTLVAHASIFFKNEDGTNFIGKNTTDPVDSSILGYELALASIVRKVYDKDGKVIWPIAKSMAEEKNAG